MGRRRKNVTAVSPDTQSASLLTDEAMLKPGKGESANQDVTFVRPHRHAGVDYVPGDSLTLTPEWAAYLTKLGVVE